MTKIKENWKLLSDRWSYLWLALGTVFLMLSTGSFGMAFAAWVAPAFLIRFFRTQKVGKGFWFTLLGLYIAYAISWQKILAPFFPLPVYLIFNLFVALQYLLPYLADRLLAPRIKGFAATIVFPLAMTTVFYLYNLVSPMGSWGTVGYEQYNNLALVQLVSVTGIWGLILLINWFGSVVNWAWERSFTWIEVRRGLLAFAVVLSLVLVYGNLRLAFSHPQPGTVRIHGFTPDLSDVDEADVYDEREAYRRNIQKANELLIEGTIREAHKGAQVILWPEMAGGGLEEETQTLMARAKEVSQKENIYLAMGIRVLYPDDDRKMENRFVMVAPSGEIIIDHDKYGAIFIYGLFPTGAAVQGEYALQTTDTPYGSLSGIVCWDADFPITVRQAGEQNADILFIANGDNLGHYKEHAQMAIFRAIENGISLVRQDWQGLSLASDPYGRILSMVDLSAAAEPVMSVQVPTHGVFTIYPIIGDLFGWLSVVGFVVIASWAIFQGHQAKRTEDISTDV